MDFSLIMTNISLLPLNNKHLNMLTGQIKKELSN